MTLRCLLNPWRFIGFRGRVASPDILQHYLGKKIPDDLRKKGAMSPVKYSPGF
ncbi:hypothetical protein GPJ65_04385 [Raoultella ornithinolytica]|nr:hypothetical protein GPJ65_04385 [Raoultella ornithinolytica]